MKKETTIQLIIIFILTIILGILLYISKDYIRTNQRFDRFPFEEETEKDTKKEDIDNGESITNKNINLSDYNSNININNGGEYTLTGKFNYSVIINTEDNVILNLDNVSINSSDTAAIANINSGDLVINLLKDTVNMLKDNGSSECDGALYSSGNLIINGSGKLNIYGNQEEGEGIATTDSDITINGGDIYIESNDDGLNAGGDNGGVITINNGNITINASGDGIDSNKDLIINGGNIYTIGSSIGGDAGIDTDGKFEINGGSIIALGSDMLKNPDKSSTQKYVSLTLKNKIEKDSKISLKDKNNNEIISFDAKDDFKTLILSNNRINSGNYYLYIDNVKTDYTISVK